MTPRGVRPRPRPGSGSRSGVCLLDVNVLVALAWPTHIHHRAARRWFADCHGQGWATAPVTEFGFVQVSSNPAAVGDPLTPAEALAVLEEIRRRPGHQTWADDISPNLPHRPPLRRPRPSRGAPPSERRPSPRPRPPP
ncbi:MAG: TA system VapC family ribonuclease toxin [Acidimicrobiia bacterium]